MRLTWAAIPVEGHQDILADCLVYEYVCPWHGPRNGVGSIGRIVGPTEAVDAFLARYSSVLTPRTLCVRTLPKAGSANGVELQIPNAVLTTVGIIFRAEGMTVVSSAAAQPGIQFMATGLPKIGEATAVPRDTPVHFNAPGYTEIVVEHPDLVLQYATAPAKNLWR